MKRAILFSGAAAIALAAMASTGMAQTTATQAPAGQAPAGDAPMGQPPMGRGPMIDFTAADADGDGKLTMEEIQSAGQARLADAFAEVDADGDGSVTTEEVVAYMQAKAEARRLARMQNAAERAMERADTNKDGVLSLDEITPPEHAKADGSFFERIDTDGDGAISKEEFDAAQARMQPRGQGRMGQDGPRDGHGQGGQDDHGQKGPRDGKPMMGGHGEGHGDGHGPQGDGPRDGQRDGHGPRGPQDGPQGMGGEGSLLPFFLFGMPQAR